MFCPVQLLSLPMYVKHAFSSIVSLTLTLLYGRPGDVTNPSTFEHVAEKFFHGSVADRATEEQTLDSVRRNVAQSWHGQQEASKPARTTTERGHFRRSASPPLVISPRGCIPVLAGVSWRDAEIINVISIACEPSANRGSLFPALNKFE